MADMSDAELRERRLLLALVPGLESSLRLHGLLSLMSLVEVRNTVGRHRRAAGAAQIELDALFALFAAAHTKPEQCARALRAYGYAAAAAQVTSGH